MPRRMGGDTDLHSNSNITKMVRVNNGLKERFFEEYSIKFPMVCRLIDFALVVFKLHIFKVCGIIGISKIEIFNLSGTERVNGLFKIDISLKNFRMNYY